MQGQTGREKDTGLRQWKPLKTFRQRRLPIKPEFPGDLVGDWFGDNDPEAAAARDKAVRARVPAAAREGPCTTRTWEGPRRPLRD